MGKIFLNKAIATAMLSMPLFAGCGLIVGENEMRELSENKPLENREMEEAFHDPFERFGFFDIYSHGSSSEDFVRLMRFGLVEGGYANGTRQYNLDASVDPLIIVVRELFPSQAGALNTGTQAWHCIANLFSSSPWNMALMMHGMYYAVIIKQCPSAIDVKLWLTSTDRFNLKNKQLKQFETRGLEHLSLLEKAFLIIKGVHTYAKNHEERERIYGKYALEKVLNCFIYKKLAGSRKDLGEYFTKLYSLMGNSDHLESVKAPRYEILIFSKMYPKGCRETEYTKNDISKLMLEKKLLERDILELLLLNMSYTPYIVLNSLCENGAALYFSRKNNIIDTKKKPFADCTETVLCHLCNIMMYRPHLGDYNIGLLRKKLDALSLESEHRERHPLSHMIAYFNEYGPKAANFCTLRQRSAWNKVVADLNDEDEDEESENTIIYVYKKEQNCLLCTWGNVCRVLHYITGISIENAPDCLEDNDIEKYIIGSLTKISKEFFEKENIVFEADGLYSYIVNKRICTGGIIKVYEQDKWEISIEMQEMQHANILSFKDYYRSDERINEININYLKQPNAYIPLVIKIANITNCEALKKQVESRWVEESKKEESTIGKLERFLGFGKMTMPESKTEIIEVLHNISELYVRKNAELISLTRHFSINLLLNQSWHESDGFKIFWEKKWQEEFMREYAPYIQKILVYDDSDVRCLAIHKETDEKFYSLRKLKNLIVLDVSKAQFTTIYLSDLINLKILILPELLTSLTLKVLRTLEEIRLPNTLEKLELESCSSLKKLLAAYTNIMEMHLSYLPCLEEIRLPKTMIAQPNGLCDLRNLKILRAGSSEINEMNLSGLFSLEEVWLPAGLTEQPNNLCELKKLRILIADSTNITKMDLRGLTFLEELTTPFELTELQIEEEVRKNLKSNYGHHTYAGNA